MHDPMTEKAASLQEAVKAKINARLKMWLQICARCGLCADACHYYLANDRDPKMVPAYKAKLVLETIKRASRVDSDWLEKFYWTIYGECTMCRRCTMFCPFGIDVAAITSFGRSLCVSQGRVPENLAITIENYLEYGNQMAITKEEWLETLEWMEEELQEELPGATIPVDKKGAHILYTVNAREPKFYPMDIAQAAKIFYLAGEDWTLSSHGWDDTNLAMFAGDLQAAAYISSLVRDAAEALAVKRVAITE